MSTLRDGDLVVVHGLLNAKARRFNDVPGVITSTREDGRLGLELNVPAGARGGKKKVLFARPASLQLINTDEQRRRYLAMQCLRRRPYIMQALQAWLTSGDEELVTEVALHLFPDANDAADRQKGWRRGGGGVGGEGGRFTEGGGGAAALGSLQTGSDDGLLRDLEWRANNSLPLVHGPGLYTVKSFEEYCTLVALHEGKKKGPGASGSDDDGGGVDCDSGQQDVCSFGQRVRSKAPRRWADGTAGCVHLFSGFGMGRIFDTGYCFRPHGGVNAQWVNEAPMPTPRIDCACVPFGSGLVLFAGGVDNHPRLANGPLKECDIYDSLANIWRPAGFVPDLNERRHGCSGCVYQGRLCVIGGSGVQSMECLLPPTPAGPPSAAEGGAGAWEWRVEQDGKCSDRVFFACGVVPGSATSCRWNGPQDVVLAAGGEGEHSGTCEFFDGIQWRPACRLRTPRSAMAHVVSLGALVLIGGRSMAWGESGKPLASVEMVWAGQNRYPSTGEDCVSPPSEWLSLPLPDMHHERLGPSAVVIGRSIYVFGGAGEAGFVRQVERLDMSLAFDHAAQSLKKGYFDDRQAWQRLLAWEIVDNELLPPQIPHEYHAISMWFGPRACPSSTVAIDACARARQNSVQTEPN